MTTNKFNYRQYRKLMRQSFGHRINRRLPKQRRSFNAMTMINDVYLILFWQNLGNCHSSNLSGLGNSLTPHITQFVEYSFELCKSDCVGQHRP